MIGDDVQGDVGIDRLAIGGASEFGSGVQNRLEEVGVVVGEDALEDGRVAFETGTGVDRRIGQIAQRAVFSAVEPSACPPRILKSSAVSNTRRPRSLPIPCTLLLGTKASGVSRIGLV